MLIRPMVVLASLVGLGVRVKETRFEKKFETNFKKNFFVIFFSFQQSIVI